MEANINKVEQSMEIWSQKTALMKREPGFYNYRDERLGFLEVVKREYALQKSGLDPDEQKSMANIEQEIRQLIAIPKESRIGRIKTKVIKVLDELARKVWEAIGRADHSNNPEQYPVEKNYDAKELRIRVSESKEDTISHLRKDVGMKGIALLYDPVLWAAIYAGEAILQVEARRVFEGGDTLKTKFIYERSPDSGRYYPVGLEAALRKGDNLRIQQEEPVAGVDVMDLQGRMRSVDWNIDYFDPRVTASADPAANIRTLEKVNGIMDDMWKLKTSGDPIAQEIHDRLAYRFFTDTPNEKILSNLSDLKQRFEVKAKVDISRAAAEDFSPPQLFNLLQGRSVLGSQGNEKGTPWHQIDLAQKDENGFHPVVPIEGSENYNVEAALLKGSVRDMENLGGRDQVGLLKSGAALEATIEKNGVATRRVIAADPANNNIALVWDETLARGLYKQPSADTTQSISKYAEQQRGIEDHFTRTPEAGHEVSHGRKR